MLSPASHGKLPQSGFINRSYTSYRMEIWHQRGWSRATAYGTMSPRCRFFYLFPLPSAQRVPWWQMGPTILKMRWMTGTRIGRSQRRWVDRHASRTFPGIILESIYSLNTHCAAVVQPLSCVRLLVTPWTAACQAPLSFTVSQSLLRFMSIESVILSNHLILCCPLLLLPSIFPSIRVFSIESALHIRWPKYWSFSFSISPSNEYWNIQYILTEQLLC